MITCMSLNLDEHCIGCCLNYECWIIGYANSITDNNSIIPSIKHIQYFPNSKQYLFLAVKLYHPQYIDRIDKMLLLI